MDLKDAEEYLKVAGEVDGAEDLRYETRLLRTRLLDTVYPYLAQVCEGHRTNLIIYPYGGMLALSLFMQRKDIHLLLMQPNAYLAEKTEQACREHGIAHRTVGTQYVTRVGEEMFRREYEPAADDPRNVDFRGESPKVWIAKDHHRSGNVVASLLGKIKVDSVSMLFPCYVKTTEIREAPYSYCDPNELSREELEKRADGVWVRSHSEALSSATRFVRKGGKLLIAQLAPRVSQESAPTVKTVEIDMGPHTHSWRSDPDQPGVILPSPLGFPDQQCEILPFVRR